MKLALRTIVMVVGLTIALIIAAYGITVLFTQTVPSSGIKPPNGGAASADCSTLTLSPSLQYSASPQDGFLNATCSGGPSFTVSQSGVFIYSADGPAPTSPPYGTGYLGIYLLNYTIWQSSACRQLNYASLTLSTDSAVTLALSKGDYVYCINYNLAAYYANAPTSLPSFPISWSS